MAKKILDLNIKHPIDGTESPGGKFGVIIYTEKLRQDVLGISYYTVDKDDICKCITDLRDDTYSELINAFSSKGRLGIYDYDLLIFDFNLKTITFKSKDKYTVTNSFELYDMMISAVKQYATTVNNVSSYQVTKIIESIDTNKNLKKYKIKKDKVLIIYAKIVGSKENSYTEYYHKYINHQEIKEYVSLAGSLTDELLEYNKNDIVKIVVHDYYKQVAIVLKEKIYSLEMKEEYYNKVRNHIGGKLI